MLCLMGFVLNARNKVCGEHKLKIFSCFILRHKIHHLCCLYRNYRKYEFPNRKLDLNTSQVVFTTGKFGNNFDTRVSELGGQYWAILFSQQLHPFVLSLKYCIYRLDMNDHLKHVVCFTRSEISMYLTEIPELSANCTCST